MYVESPFKTKTLVQVVGQGSAKPFLKWVGGKTQLIDQLDSYVPSGLQDGTIDTYIEPFVGGGSFFFHIAQKYPVKRLIIADSNQDLILAYWTIKERASDLIERLQSMKAKYLSLDEAEREKHYYQIRKTFNDRKALIDMQSFSVEWIERTAQLIFLNKTCFNGLFRVNAAGLFNVAFGKYDNPKICDPDNLLAVSRILQGAQILLGDFTCVREHLDSKAFAYLDPPYRPLTATSNFTGYSSSTFTAEDQIRLASFCRESTEIGCRLMISNSDPNNIDSTDTYFQDNYPGYRIERALANRMVNCKADRRGKISELIIMNYPYPVSGTEVNSSEETKTSPIRRSAAALGAFQLFHDCARSKKNFNLEDLQKVTGWKSQTARTYLSKKWKSYVEPVEGAKPPQFGVRASFLKLDEEGFLKEFSQVLSSPEQAPQSEEGARQQVLVALNTYAEFLASAQNLTAEKRIRQLIEEVTSI